MVTFIGEGNAKVDVLRHCVIKIYAPTMAIDLWIFVDDECYRQIIKMHNIGKWKRTKTTVTIQVKSPVDVEKRRGSKGRSFDVTKVDLLHLMQTVSYVLKPNDQLDHICDRLKFRVPVTILIFVFL